MSEENQEQETIVPVTVVPDFCQMYDNLIKMFDEQIAPPPSNDKEVQRRVFTCLTALINNQAFIARELAREQTNDPTWAITPDELEALANQAAEEFAGESDQVMTELAADVAEHTN